MSRYLCGNVRVFPSDPIESGARAPIFRRRPRAGAGLCGLLIALLGACASQPPPPATPEATLIAFTRSINQGHFKEAYALMSEEYRQRVPFSRFQQQLTENPQETVAMTNALLHVQGAARQQAVLRYGDDQQVVLKRRPSDQPAKPDAPPWLIATPLVDFYDQSSPRAALRAFVRAMERRRYDVVMRLIPESDKEGITTERMEEAWSGDAREDIERMLEALRAHLDAPIEVVGNRATMPYGDGARVQFVREGKDWKIEDPE